MADAKSQTEVNWVARAIDQLNGPSEAMRAVWGRGVRVSAATLGRAKRSGKVGDADLACALSELTGISVFLLAGRDEPTEAQAKRRKPSRGGSWHTSPSSR
ncbi:MAG: hypothetical protein KIT14_13865 [bacterium]|nr:hypothetical protein [bacterium]